MKYLGFEIQNYRAIEDKLTIDLRKNKLLPVVGINESGKTTILQAIYCFDYLNDSEYEGRHLKNLINLYKTSDNSAVVSAIIEISYEKLAKLCEDAIKENNTKQQKLIEKEEDEEKKKLLKQRIYSTDFSIKKENYKNTITIKRNLSTKQYSISIGESKYRPFFNNILAKHIIDRMPYILYNDDFMDRPPNYIEIPRSQPDTLTGWLAIFQRLFESTNENYSLFDLADEEDERRRRSILSDVESELNKTLTKDWKKLSVTKNDLKIALSFAPDKSESKDKSHTLNVQVIEKIKERERFFDVIDRSKGFLWFFNFVMKLVYNPKVTRSNINGTIYLLDEPGSYLHQSAQDKLCNKLVEISKLHGNVIYCTHSHKLLNPDLIPLNSIYIVEKDRQKKIKATALPNVKTNVENTTAFQPVLEALQTPAFEVSIGNNEKIIAVEGIYDKYAIELMIKFDNSTRILPGTSADSILKNIQYLNAFNKLYIAIWDNDPEGEESYKKAKKFFGEIESEKFDLLPKGRSKKRRMEEMFLGADLEMIKDKLGLNSSATYESVVSTLYFADKKEKQKIVSAISEETKNNFLILEKVIEKRFLKSQEILNKTE